MLVELDIVQDPSQVGFYSGVIVREDLYKVGAAF